MSGGRGPQENARKVDTWLRGLVRREYGTETALRWDMVRVEEVLADRPAAIVTTGDPDPVTDDDKFVVGRGYFEPTVGDHYPMVQDVRTGEKWIRAQGGGGTILYGNAIGGQVFPGDPRVLRIFEVGVGALDVDEAYESLPLPFACTARNLYVTTGTAQPAGGSATFIVRKNGADTAIQLVIAPGSAAGTYSDTTHSARFAAGDLLSISFDGSAAAGSAEIWGYGLTLAGRGGIVAGSMGGDLLITGDPGILTLFDNAINPAVAEEESWLPLPFAATVRNFRINLSAPHTGSSTFSVRKNQADTALQIVLSAGAAAGVHGDTAHSVSFAAGDLLSFGGSTPGGSSPILGFSVEVSRPPFVFAGLVYDSLFAVEGASILSLFDDGANRILAEADEIRGSFPVPHDCVIGELFINTDEVHASGSSTFTVRKNGVPTAIRVVIGTGAAAGTYRDSTNTESFAAGDVLSVGGITTATASPTLLAFGVRAVG